MIAEQVAHELWKWDRRDALTHKDAPELWTIYLDEARSILRAQAAADKVRPARKVLR